jgi:arylformamidase
MDSAVWHIMDQEALDKQYATRSQIGDGYSAWNAARRSASAEARVTLKPLLDIPYGQGARQRLDLFAAPRSSAPNPIAVFFHGGFWKSGDKDDLSLVATGLRSLGASTILPNYPLSPAATVQDAVESCLEAVAWVVKHANEFGGDPNNIWLCGHSAGAHLAVSCCERLAADKSGSQPAKAVKAALVTSGIYQLEPIRLSYLNKDLNLRKSDADKLSPTNAAAFLKIPVVVAVGEDESAEFIRQSEALVAAIESLGAEVAFCIIPATSHYTMIEQWRPDSDLLSRFKSAMST